MWAARQVALGLAYAVIPALLVMGSLALALTETSPTRPTSIQPTRTTTLATPEPTGSATAVASSTAPVPSATRTAQPTPTISVTTPPTQTAVVFTPSWTPSPSPQVPLPQSQPYYSPVEGCGAFPGWILGYVVRPGDSLYRIAIRYRTTVAELQQANCKSSSTIFIGERLCVPALTAPPWGHLPFLKRRTPWADPLGPAYDTPAFP
jgi:LysM domain